MGRDGRVDSTSWESYEEEAFATEECVSWKPARSKMASNTQAASDGDMRLLGSGMGAYIFLAMRLLHAKCSMHSQTARVI
eukprot:757549-Hanusia_phi.AAC.4